MPTSPSIHQCLPLTQSSVNNNLKCTSDIKLDCHKKSENDVGRSLKRHLHKSNSFFRKHMQRPIIVHDHKSSRRRYTFSGYQDSKMVFKKRRRLSSIAWPTKFLLGGSRTDPLNLRSLEDESINQQLNACSPASSPMPIPPRRCQVQVVIPPNIYDPLNLNTGEDIELHLSKARKRRRHRKSRREEHENQFDSKDLSPTEEFPCIEFETPIQSTSLSSPQPSFETDSVANDSLVETCKESPETSMLSLDESSKSISSSISKERDEKLSAQKLVLKRRRSKARIQKADTIKFRANAEKFCYGNHVTSHSNWNFDGSTGDSRIGYLDMKFFSNKDVLDVGCNNGKLTLLIAKHFHPNKINGIDIDKKLVNIAQRQLREMNQSCLSSNMPQSMSLLYGPLVKMMQHYHGSQTAFPNNITFLEANYVPACEEYLETQKPEYDTILCLRVTKWIHLNFGDEGLKLAFKRMYAQLRVGGHLILEPQPWFTYSASKRITPSIYKTYLSLKMRPESFCDYLLSSEVGFSSCDIIGRSINYVKGYRHNIYLLTKGYQNSNEDLVNTLSPIPFHSDEWTHGSDDNYDILDYFDAVNDYSEVNIQS